MFKNHYFSHPQHPNKKNLPLWNLHLINRRCWGLLQLRRRRIGVSSSWQWRSSWFINIGRKRCLVVIRSVKKKHFQIKSTYLKVFYKKNHMLLEKKKLILNGAYNWAECCKQPNWLLTNKNIVFFISPIHRCYKLITDTMKYQLLANVNVQ